MPVHAIRRWPVDRCAIRLALSLLDSTTDPTRSDLETRPMTRPTGHPAAKPFRLTRSAVEAHRAHLPTPFLGCPVCARRPPLSALHIRWSSPRLG